MPRSILLFVVAVMFTCVSGFAQEAAVNETVERSAHGLQEGLATPLAVGGEESTPAPVITVGPKASTPPLRPQFINFGYLQSESVIPGIRWNALTHIATLFVDFNASATFNNPSAFTGRHSALKAGGAAQNAGVKVILCVRNADFDETILSTVMTNASLRTTLVNNIMNLIQTDSYCQGVNFDFEFSWGTTTRNGITAFFQEMRTALDAVNPDLEMSVYTHAIFDGNKWNVPVIAPLLDYMCYSTYDWASGNTAHAISDHNNCMPYIDDYITSGMPPEKIVLTWASYGRRWTGITAYNDTGTTPASRGFTDGLWATTLEPDYGGPYTNNYVTGDEGAWYTYTVPGSPATDYVVTWDDPRSLEYKIRTALAMPSVTNGVATGRRLGGVGWWSLMWMAESTSRDVIAGANESEADDLRTYPHIYQLCEEILSAPGDETFLFEAFEYANPAWADPNESVDTTGDTDNDSWLSLMTSPAGTGRPASTNMALRLRYEFNQTSGNKMFFRHRPLNDSGNTGIMDKNAGACRVDQNTEFVCPIYVGGDYSPRTIRMALLDSLGQVEVSDPVTLDAAGWRTLVWDITDAGQINAYDTSEVNLVDGNGVLNSAGAGARDISFLGFVIEGGSSVAIEDVYFDELSYRHKNPGGLNYVINEFQYNVAGSEFVEIYGPAGTIPANTVLRFYNSADGSVLSSVAIGGQTIPGSGLFVVGDTGVPNVNLVPAGWGATGNIPNTNPSAIQIYNSATGNVYDSVVYEAMGGLADLKRAETMGVTNEGYGWMGESASGTTAGGVVYTTGRYPNGTDTQVNENDFSFMPASPGALNAESPGTLFNFDTAPTNAFQTYQAFAVNNRSAAGIPASPNGGNVYRCVDTTGGGVVGSLGGFLSGNHNVSGYLWIPSTGDPQALAVGICVSQGSTFFSDLPNASGYENGYWLIYEHGTVNLSDGQANHAGSFQFVQASNDNMDASQTTALGSTKTLAQVGASAGSWVTFNLAISPGGATGQQLLAQINNVDVFRGDIPAGGRTSGRFAVGFRENVPNPDTVAAAEGTWVDGVGIGNYGVPVQLSGFVAE